MNKEQKNATKMFLWSPHSVEKAEHFRKTLFVEEKGEFGIPHFRNREDVTDEDVLYMVTAHGVCPQCRIRALSCSRCINCGWMTDEKAAQNKAALARHEERVAADRRFREGGL